MNLSRPRFPPFLVLLAFFCPTSSYVHADEAAIRGLHRGVKQIGSPGVPGNVCVFGETAFAVVQDAGNNAVVAATEFGKGRVVLWGHNGYFSKKALQTADTGRLMLNSIAWAARGKTRPRVGFVGRGDCPDFLTTAGQNVSRISLGDFEDVDVLIGPVELGDESLHRKLAPWVRQGGGVISAATGWGWAQIHRGKDLRTDFSANRFFAPMGLVFANGYAKDSAQDSFVVSGTPSPLLNASLALNAFVNNSNRRQKRSQKLSKEHLVQIGSVLTLAMQSLPPDDTVFLPKLKDAMKAEGSNPRPTSKRPITNERVLARLVLTEQIRESQDLPPAQVTAHPSALEFPGAAPSRTPTTRRVLEIDTTTPGWHSTGLYANPGDLITVAVPSAAADKGLKVRLGSTTCRLWDKDKWFRCPEITREFELSQDENQAASAFGGLIYLVVPDNCQLGQIQVTINGGIEAPYFVLGETSPSDWKRRLRSLPAPWAELASTKAILTVPSTEIRGLDDPASLLEAWDDILDAAADLAQRPRERERPQRYVADIQLCAGYMHAGNPIMVPTSTAGRLVDRNHLIKKGDWGFYHETGHMHQHKDWTFEGTGEVTVNLFTMYIFDKVCAIPPEKGRMTEANVQKQYVSHFRNGCPFNEWKSKPFLALYMYYQLQQEFGWDAFKKVFAEYRDLPNSARPKTDDERRDQWMVRFSRTVGRNLGPFFKAWGVPTSAAAQASISDLPAWMPKDFPPRS